MATRNPIAKALGLSELRNRVLPDKRQKISEEQFLREISQRDDCSLMSGYEISQRLEEFRRGR